MGLAGGYHSPLFEGSLYLIEWGRGPLPAATISPLYSPKRVGAAATEPFCLFFLFFSFLRFHYIIFLLYYQIFNFEIMKGP